MDNLFALLIKEGFKNPKQIYEYSVHVTLPKRDKEIQIYLSDSRSNYYLEGIYVPLSAEELIEALKKRDEITAQVGLPPPQPRGIVVPDALIAYMKQNKYYMHEELCELVSQRDAFGRVKYGQPLMSQDGRDGVEDARQEAGDLLQYAYKVYLAGDKEGLEKIRRLTNAVAGIIELLTLEEEAVQGE